MRLVLEIVSGPLTGQKISVEEQSGVRVGRTTKSDFATEDTFMSREHFMVECDGKECRLRDLKSRNGTEVNGEAVTEVTLKEGDRIHAGHTDFVAHIETIAAEEPPPKELADTIPPAEEQPAVEEKVSEKPAQTPSLKEVLEGSEGRTSLDPSVWKKMGVRPSTVEPAQELSAPEPVESQPAPEVARPAPPRADLQKSLASYEAATPEGRLLHILRNQPEPLMALLDATRESAVLEMLRASGEEFQSLYKDEANAKIAPYLVRLPPQSMLLKRMTREGWGKGWGVYLTCTMPLRDLREYFRRTLMVATPDGMEFFSRFYDPRFFRNFLNTCTSMEADRFFGPISSYLMEDERPEILLEYTRSPRGAEKKGHLLSMPE